MAIKDNWKDGSYNRIIGLEKIMKEPAKINALKELEFLLKIFEKIKIDIMMPARTTVAPAPTIITKINIKNREKKNFMFR